MSQQGGQFSGETYSVVEDLDPEPGSGRGAGLRLDLILGGALLLAVILFAGWQWWRQDFLSGQYRAGQEAAGRNDWETAIHFFTEASGYADADALARGAQEQIDERDRLYRAALENAKREEWLSALRDIRAAARIQPDYKDLAEREETALQKVYFDALGGTVVARNGVEPPGLYYHAPSGWVYLQGSDTFSRLRNETTEDGRLVYDIADEGWTRPPGQAPGPYEWYELEGRHLMYAQVTSDTIKYKQLALDPVYYEQQIVGKHGVWGMHHPQNGENWPAIAPVVRITATGAQRMAYQPFESTGVYTVEIKPVVSHTATSDFVVAIDPDSSRYLVADWTNVRGTEVTTATVAQLYLAEAGVEGRRLIYTHTGGGFHSAQFSPDGRSLVAQTYSVVNRMVERQALVLIDLDGKLSPRIITDIVTDQLPYRPPEIYVGAAFARAGAFAGDLVAIEYQSDHTHVRILDPYNLSGPPEAAGAYIDVNVPGRAKKDWMVVSQDAEGLVVAGHDYSGASYEPHIRTLTIVSIPARNLTRIYEVPMTSSTYWNAFQIAPDLFAWSSYVSMDPYNARSEPYVSVESIPRIQPGNVEITPTTAITLSYGSRINDAFSAPTVNLGQKVFAYTTEHQLHARNYGGTIDVMLESGARYIYPDVRHTWHRDALK